MADGVSDRFPAGLRVLVVDDDLTCLRILEQMLRKCLYEATTCSHASAAMNILRERKGCFDVVLSDVHMPDMDGFRLLELVGLEMDLPVIMMSADMSTSAVMRGINHGACDYLIKPIREEELKNIWQHVVRKKWIERKELEHPGGLEGIDRPKRGNNDVDYASSINEGTNVPLRAQKKNRDVAEDMDDGELDNDDPTTSKKPRVVWSVELHQQFVGAVNQLGIDKAVPKRILELMNVPGLTRENVASHLQKFRLYLKRLSGVAQQQSGIPNTFCVPMDSNLKLGSPLGRLDIPALAASGQIPPQTLAALHAELYGQPAGSLGLGAVSQPALLQASLQGPKCIPAEPGFSFGQPLIKCQSNLSRSYSQSLVCLEDDSSGLGAWPSNSISTVGSAANLRGVNTRDSNILVDILPQQQQQQMPMQPEPNCTINVQPSCLVVPTRPSASFQARNNLSSADQSCSFSRSSGLDYCMVSPGSNISSLGSSHGLDGDNKSTGVLTGYSAPNSISPSVSSRSMHAGSSTRRQVQQSSVTFSANKQLEGPDHNILTSQGFCSKSSEAPDHGPLRNLGFDGKRTYIPSRFAVDEVESSTSNLAHGTGESDGNRVKQETELEFLEVARVGTPALPNFSSNDFMGVFSD